MAAARKYRYNYVGISDQSQSLKIAPGVSGEDLWDQIRFIDKMHGRARGFHSQIERGRHPAGGSLDYPDDVLKELD